VCVNRAVVDAVMLVRFTLDFFLPRYSPCTFSTLRFRILNTFSSTPAQVAISHSFIGTISTLSLLFQ
jgi:hypothetical protein